MPLHLSARILTEVGPSIGLGHLVRCVAIYDALSALGCACELVVEGEVPTHVVETRRARSFPWRTPGAAISASRDADIVVVDSYIAELVTYRAIAETAPAAVYLDDTVRLAYPNGIVVNANPEAASLDWSDVSDASLLLGPRYQLLRAEFHDLPDRMVADTIRRIMVIAGGTDALAAREELAASVAAALPKADIDVVMEYRSASEMRDAMLAADVAVSAAGQTLYELAAAGTPTVAVIVADNQRSQARALERAGALLLAGRWGAEGTEPRLAKLLGAMRSSATRTGLSSESRRLVDGHGAQRVARAAIGRALDTRIIIRGAREDDEAALLCLANDPLVRDASFASEPIFAASHHAWFQARRADQDCLLLLAWDGDELVGQVRFDRERATATISIALAERYRGFGLSGRLLARSIAFGIDRFPDVEVLVALVKGCNAVSRRLFEGAGFALSPETAGLPVGAVRYEMDVR